MRVLVADDRDMNRHHFIRVFRRFGWEVSAEVDAAGVGWARSQVVQPRTLPSRLSP
jgi:hypothetical protein